MAYYTTEEIIYDARLMAVLCAYRHRAQHLQSSKQELLARARRIKHDLTRVVVEGRMHVLQVENRETFSNLYTPLFSSFYEEVLIGLLEGKIKLEQLERIKKLVQVPSPEPAYAHS